MKIEVNPKLIDYHLISGWTGSCYLIDSEWVVFSQYNAIGHFHAFDKLFICRINNVVAGIKDENLRCDDCLKLAPNEVIQFRTLVRGKSE